MVLKAGSINGKKMAGKLQAKKMLNQDLWIKLDEEIMKHNIEWNWVKGHSNNQLNEKARLASKKIYRGTSLKIIN